MFTSRLYKSALRTAQRSLSRSTRRVTVARAFSTTDLSFDKYPFLKDLGLQAENNVGVFDGEWKASGVSIDSTTPIDNSRIATVQLGTCVL
jgi:aldehyde dehydrogenase family 7 protein A1